MWIHGECEPTSEFTGLRVASITNEEQEIKRAEIYRALRTYLLVVGSTLVFGAV